MNYRFILCLLLVVAMTGVVSADTLLLYANNDGQIYATSSSATWQTLRDAAGTTATDNATNPFLIYLTAHASTSDRYIRLFRYPVTFNASELNNGTVTSAVLRLKYSSKVTTLGGTNEATIVLGSPTNPLDFVAGDYNNLNLTAGSPNELASRFDFSSSGAGSNINFTLSSSGRSTINTNNTPFTYYVLDGDELDNSFSGTWSASTNRYVRVNGVSDATQANRPYLEIVYTPAAGESAPVASFTLNKNYIRIPNSVTATDTSTSWEWSWGDGTANSTTQNPTHQYAKRGKFDIYLTATNAGGSGTTGATSVRVTGYENYY
jgi:hypothetical protein